MMKLMMMRRMMKLTMMRRMMKLTMMRMMRMMMMIVGIQRNKKRQIKNPAGANGQVRPKSLTPPSPRSEQQPISLQRSTLPPQNSPCSPPNGQSHASPIPPVSSPLEQLVSPIQPVSSPLEQLVSPIQPVSSPLTSTLQPVVSPLQQVVSPLTSPLLQPVSSPFGNFPPLFSLLSPPFNLLFHPYKSLRPPAALKSLLRQTSPTQEAPPTPKSPKSPKSPPKSPKKDEDPEKVAFMVSLGLVTTEHLEEIQLKRQERKRRSTANPAYSGLFEPERKRLASHYLNSSLFLSARDSEDFCWKEDVEHEDVCAVCQEEGELQLCHVCPRAFHPTCLHPPLRTPPRGPWYCPKCQKKVLNKENMSWPQNFVQSYVTHKTVRQEEKRRLLRRNSELKKEFTHLEEQDDKLNDTLKQCMEQRERLLLRQHDATSSLQRLRDLIALIQKDQLIHVSMATATTTTTTTNNTAIANSNASSLLNTNWSKNTTSSSSSSSQPMESPDANN
ncbi:LOW QUALITY PROTEIN: PHD finger protein 21B [Trematomus bernacchii]|uniref:LOW QUALITY PROTEIN: PHD finger protein 21B n=1 Tax=Trematomus bernacchii TaxID=40690 RepID=UPI00146F1EBA|nr:LOW QUALITY PROTEIN: PHD finger protein 21B [Trematomus bernacchii]